MFLESFFRRLLLILVWVALLIIAIWFASLGLLGSRAEGYFQIVFEWGKALYLGNGVVLQRTAVVLSAILAAIPASLAIYRAWYFADRNLPTILEQFVSRRMHAHLEDKSELLEKVALKPIRLKTTQPLVNPLTFYDDFGSYGIQRISNNVERFGQQISDLKNVLGTLSARQDEVKSQILNAHLLKGLCLSQNGSEDSALEEFEVAIDFSNGDQDASEFAIAQAIAAKRYTRAGELAARLLRKCNKDVLRRTRVRRMQATLKELEGTSSSLDRGRAILTSAINELVREDLDHFKKTLELAKCHLLLGEIQTTRGKFTAARNALNSARAFFDELPVSGIRIAGSTAVDEAKKKTDRS